MILGRGRRAKLAPVFPRYLPFSLSLFLSSPLLPFLRFGLSSDSTRCSRRSRMPTLFVLSSFLSYPTRFPLLLPPLSLPPATPPTDPSRAVAYRFSRTNLSCIDRSRPNRQQDLNSWRSSSSASSSKTSRRMA